MPTLIFEGVRCFHTYHECELRPITLLVGENSSGKTTFLALNRIAWDVVDGNLSDDIFNEEPFMLGSYNQIASFRGGRAGRVRSFSIGMRVPLKPSLIDSELGFGNEVQIMAKFASQNSQARWQSWEFKSGTVTIIVKPAQSQNRLQVSVKYKGQEVVSEKAGYRAVEGINRYVLANLPYYFARDFKKSDTEQLNMFDQIPLEFFLRVRRISNYISDTIGPRPYAFAPIRTRPQRTYDLLQDIPKPEGSHIPMVLANLLSKPNRKTAPLRDLLVAFGSASGLFKDLEIQQKGNKDGDPFQIGVKTMRQTFNLVDVGYGVSQVLPIIVDAARSNKRSRYLLQQPEVHLHPRAQAELGTFFSGLAKEQNKQFVVETHSDYMIDRIRMCLRDNSKLNHLDVRILYFEKAGSEVSIYDLKLDSSGNIVDAPQTYRQFFLQEERRILGVD